ncbi:hypothetical protein ACFVXG_38025 [Kitasatospora sp. NPDC058162]|uniref:hypothetical protein n=1 Tax=Kitasatospora sp. NPDC058162 TaxID=3346362 RepID=UPI0036DD17C7
MLRTSASTATCSSGRLLLALFVLGTNTGIRAIVAPSADRYGPLFAADLEGV